MAILQRLLSEVESLPTRVLHEYSSTSLRQFTRRISQGAMSHVFQSLRPRTASIHILDDNSLHHVFYFCRPFSLGEDDITGPFGEHWTYKWYTHAHVCQRWRRIILGSAASLDLSLVCAHGTPITDTLAHSPPLLLIFGYFTKGLEPNTEEEGLVIALKQRDRMRRVRLGNPAAIMQRLIMTMDEEYPTLEYLYITLPVDDTGSILQIEVNRTEWRKLFGPFGNVKSLWIENGFVRGLSRCLELEDRELPLELFPELQ